MPPSTTNTPGAASQAQITPGGSNNGVPAPVSTAPAPVTQTSLGINDSRYINSAGYATDPSTPSPANVAPTPITPESLAPANPVQIPSTPASAGGGILGGLISSVPVPTGHTLDATGNLVPVQTTDANGGVKGELASLYAKLSGESSAETGFNNEEQVSTKQADAVSAYNKYQAAKTAYAQNITNIQNGTGENPGGTTSTANAQISEVSRTQNADLANLAILANAAQGNYSAAVNIVAGKVKAAFDPINNQISTLEKFYALNQNDLTDSQKTQLQGQIAAQKATVTGNASAYKSALTAAVSNHAPASVLTAIDAAAHDPNATEATILAAAGTYADTTKFTGAIEEYEKLVSAGIPLPASVAALPKDQQPYAYAQYKAALGRAPKTGPAPTKFSTSTQTDLINAGLTGAEITHLEEGIQQYGLNEVLSKEAGMTEAQKDIIRTHFANSSAYTNSSTGGGA